MIYTERRDEYLRRAADAKAQVAKASDPVAREAWERIAASYRDLASLAAGRDSRWHA